MSRRIALFSLLFASGFAGLVYEVLWLRQLALVFGNTAEAAATTLAAYFLGMAAGQHAAGKRVGSWPSALRAYALLELAVAASAAAALLVLPAYRALYPHLFAALGERALAFAAAKLVLGLAVLLAPTFCMGATLPVMGSYLVGQGEPATTFALLYAVQTIGGAAGALAAGFYLPRLFGFRGAYATALAASAAVGGAALALARSERIEPARPAPRRAPATARTRASRGLTPASAVALLSGFATLSVEVLWTQMFARVLHNSVYSFAAILVTFLFALGLGGLLARALARVAAVRPWTALCAVLLASAFAVAATPFVFHAWTGGLAALGSAASWPAYVGSIFASAAVVMLVPGVLIGGVFPYLLKLEERGLDTGAAIGKLASANTVGAVAGSVASAFVLLPWLGLWGSVRAIALLYALGAFAAALSERARYRWLPALPAIAIVLLLTLFDPTQLPAVRVDPDENLVELFEGASGAVAVVARGELLSIELDGHYSLGANGAVANDRRQGELPLLLHPAPRSVFFLGMGTGITAGGALFHPLERVTTCELVPGVVAAARKYFAPYDNGLFDDPRSRVVIADGRNYLLGTADRYDVIVADLFVPWHAGTGSLYTREHFAAARDRLTENGVFAQWLPLYQMSRRELAIVARTMLDVFPQVTLWRGDWLPYSPVVALVGHASAAPLDLDAVVATVRRRKGGEGYAEDRAKALTMMFYAGNVGAARALFAAAPPNTDDHPEIEYLAPRTERAAEGGSAKWLIGDDLVRFYAELADAAPPRDDPYLARLSAAETELARAGAELYRASVDEADGRAGEARRDFEEFSARVPAEISRIFAGVLEEQRE